MGVALGLSTMAAAGCGNMVSDVLGIGISGWIEARTMQAAHSNALFTLAITALLPIRLADARLLPPRAARSARATPRASAPG